MIPRGSDHHLRYECGGSFSSGAAVAFGLMGMAEEIRARSCPSSGTSEEVRRMLTPVSARLFGDSEIPREERDALAAAVEGAMCAAELAEIAGARNEAAAYRRAYLHEKKRAEDAIQWLRAYEPGPAKALAARAYKGSVSE